MNFMICPQCKHDVERRQVSVVSISNFLVGGAPPEISALTDVEVAFISANRTLGHFLMIQGGASKKIQGFHTLLKSNVQKVFDSVRLIERLSSTDKIAVVLAGPFTRRQNEAAKKRCEIRLSFGL